MPFYRTLHYVDIDNVAHNPDTVIELDPVRDAHHIEVLLLHDAIRELASQDPVVDLPEGFPKRDLLVAAGFATRKRLRHTDDRDLANVKGIGASSVVRIRAALSELD